MNEQEALAKMIAPGTRRKGKYREGVIQIMVTRACDKACFGCTQGSNLAGKPSMMTVEQFGQAVESLRGYFGVVGMFGGNPAMHPYFLDLCRVLRDSWVPKEQRGIWSNHPISPINAAAMRLTFNPAVSNLNVHLDQRAYDMFKEGWPECGPVGLHQDSRHSPPFVAMKDVLKKECPTCQGSGEVQKVHDSCLECLTCPHCEGTGQYYDKEKAWELISDCDINKHWSALIGTFRGKLMAWFCEVAGAQAMLHEHEANYPSTGYDLELEVPLYATNPNAARWWQLPMQMFSGQVRKHCHDCGVPLRGYGELACNDGGKEQVSATHAGIYRPKRQGRQVEVVTELVQLGTKGLKVTEYLQGATK